MPSPCATSRACARPPRRSPASATRSIRAATARQLLLELADQRGVAGEHVAMMRALKAALPETIGRDLPVNVNGPIPAILLDLGWPVTALKGIGLCAAPPG
jgi:hypothetical protein